MTVTIELKNSETFNLLRSLESLGLIHVKTSIVRDEKFDISNENHSRRWLRGCCKDLPGSSVDDFLTHCHTEKERELAAEKRQSGKKNNNA